MKETYRKKYRIVRKNIKNKSELDKLIYEKVINNKHIKNSNLILIYVSKEDEIDTFNLITYFLANNKHVAVPKIKDNQMDFYYIKSLSELKLGYFKILEPITNNIVTNYDNAISIIPGICFSKELHRIGYGKGFYDKFLKEHSDIYKIGLCYKECLLDRIPHDEYDIKLDEIITS